jgi:hypothetical protein
MGKPDRMTVERPAGAGKAHGNPEIENLEEEKHVPAPGGAPTPTTTIPLTGLNYGPPSGDVVTKEPVGSTVTNGPVRPTTHPQNANWSPVLTEEQRANLELAARRVNINQYIDKLPPGDRHNLVKGVLQMVETVNGGTKLLLKLRALHITDKDIAVEFLALTRTRTIQSGPGATAAPPKEPGTKKPAESWSLGNALRGLDITEEALHAAAEKDMTAIGENLVNNAKLQAVEPAKPSEKEKKREEDPYGGLQQRDPGASPGAQAAVAQGQKQKEEALLKARQELASKGKAAEAYARTREKLAKAEVARNIDQRDNQNPGEHGHLKSKPKIA